MKKAHIRSALFSYETGFILHDMQRGVFRGCSRKIKVWISVRNQHTQSTPKGEVCKNDLSFMFGVTMNLYEHQSTWNENMPLRGFFYFSELYQRYLKRQNIKLTDEKKPVMVPFPKYVVFYNGTAICRIGWK